MTGLIRFLREYFFPNVSAEAQKELDRESLNNIRHICRYVLIIESALMAYFLSTVGMSTEGARASFISISLCVIMSLLGFLASSWLQKRIDCCPKRIVAFNAVFFIAYTAWAIAADYRHYIVGRQMLTFFTVELMLVCFVPFRPWLSSLLISGAFLALYCTMYLYNGCAGVNVPNFVVFAFVSAVGMAVRYHTQVHLSNQSVSLRETNKRLEYNSRHDNLTGLRNRQALDEDAHALSGKALAVYMIDINYFKEINDEHGHTVGDAVLRETSDAIKRLYPDCHRYRYGGDEFLVLREIEKTEVYDRDTYHFDWRSARDSVSVLLSIGAAEGTPSSHEELFTLISQADAALYDVKKRTHSPQFGGHDRRQERR